jgi:alkylation response protein AidB-like acyl-CoA dehydrogenase
MVVRETDEHRALRDAVAMFLGKRSSEARVRELMASDSDSGYDASDWHELADMGLLGCWPEEFGGAGAGHVEIGIVMEEMGRALLCAPFFSTAVLTTRC